ncbi:isochorismatase family protein [Microbacterium terrisoli]|uniref:isochorismatase family protein n=1 Tax=Microbacterium terrisoli TaxID=3242192 RepID=UPI0028049E5C|nr:isochorismatase family protein [Microbacterium protaetiae]
MADEVNDQHAARAGVLTDADAGFETRLEPGSAPALLVVDMMRAYFEPGAQLYMGDASSLEAAAELLSAARGAGIPIIHTRVSYAPGGADGGRFFEKVGALRHLVGDTPLGQIMPQVAPAGDEPVLVKQYASAFFGTVLDTMLRTLGVDTLLIAGVSTSGCIRATAVDAVQYGFIPIVVRQAVGDRDPRTHEQNLYDIQAKYGEVYALQDAVAYLGRLR